MIREAKGNLLQSDAEALVNTVNCVGAMGKGIALQFKQAFPENFRAYEKAVRAGDVRPGRMFVFATGQMVNPRYIVNFPTKRHWRGPSRMEDIERGLEALVDEIRRLGIRSIAVPPLGCGSGGLGWGDVRPKIEAALAILSDVDVLLYPPLGAPPAATMPIRTARPRMTIARALLIRLMTQYRQLGYRLTLLEVHKLAYFMQEAGEPLRLRYEAGPYGPFAANLNKVLERLEGHFVSGYGDSPKPDVELDLVQTAVDEAERALEPNADSRQRLQRVANLIEGFETPYGMELLASVHWVAMHRAPPALSPDDVVSAVHSWNERKRAMFRPEHIRLALRRLADEGWTATP